MEKLKTLKDIAGRFHIIALDERTPISNKPIAKATFNNQPIMYGYEMNTNGTFIKIDDIKQEAIKLVKNRIELAKIEYKKNGRTPYFMQLCAVQKDFMKFFNITEEDLK